MFIDFIDLRHGPDREPGGQDALHVRRQGQRCRWSSARQRGVGRRRAAQHSQSLEAWFVHVPGLKVVMPVDPVRRQGPAEVGHPRRQPGHLLRAQDALRDQGAGAGRGRVPLVPLGQAEVSGEGRHVTIVATPSWSPRRWRRPRAGRRGHRRRGHGPADHPPWTWRRSSSVKKTKRAVVAQEAGRGGVGAEIAATISRRDVRLAGRAGEAGGGQGSPPYPSLPPWSSTSFPRRQTSPPP